MVNLLKRVYRFCSGHYNVLLIYLFLLFIFRPYGRVTFYIPLWKFLFAASLLAAIFNCKHNRSIRIICSLLAIPAVVLSWLTILKVEPATFIANQLVSIAFLGVCVCSILYDVILRAKVNLETLRGVICAYFLVAFIFAYLYYLIEYVDPGTFHMNNRQVSPYIYSEYFSEMLYFSFGTLLTIGYGDIVAVKDIGQTAAILEGILGQFYIAILVARIVSIYTLYSDSRSNN